MTQTPTTYTAHDIPDLINAVPTLFGFRPTESLIAVATHGPRRRFGFRLRVDIPGPENVDALAAVVVGHLTRQNAEGAIFIAVTEQQETARALLGVIEKELGDIVLIVAARADGHRYWSDEPGFPAEGIAYETSDHHLSIVRAVASGQAILPDREALVDRFRPVEGPRRRWLENAAEAMIAQVVPRVSRCKEGELAALGIGEIQPIIDRGLAGNDLDDEAIVGFFIWASAIGVRDEVWAQITRDNAARMLRLLTLVSRSTIVPFEPAVLSLAAFAAWLSGDGAQALIAVERALTADPAYSMGRLILQMLESGLSPDAWEGFDLRGRSEAV